MKKIFSILALAIVAFGFSACEDIPSPYEIIEDIIEGPEEEVIDPVGDGTAATPFNVAGIIEYCKSLGADVNSEKEVYFTGIVTRFKDGEEPGNSYGNATFWISDTGSEADEFYCFRCYGPGNKKFTSADQMKVGDKVTLCAKVVNYKGNTPETVQGSAYVALVGDGTIEGGNDGPAADPVGDGTQASPYNVSAALKFTSALAADTESAPVYVKGIVCDDPDIDTGNYGNATFHISDNGENSNSFYCFRVMDFGGKKFTSANFKKGDEVVITGPLVNYKGNTPETVANKCSLYSVNGKSEGGNTDTPDTPTIGAKGSGTAADPYNVAGVLAYTKGLAADVNSDKEVYFTGIVKNFKAGEEPGNQYGNATFYIIDEGGSEDFYCFRVLGKDGAKFTEGAEAPAVGDKVTIRGLVVNYKGNTPETVSGKAYVEAIVKGEGGNVTPGGGEDTPVIDEDKNGDFESWSGSTPLNWTTSSTAGNATLKQSTDAHSGKYSVEVGGTASGNKRLGRKEMTLEAGTYTMTFWVKAASSAGGSVRPGFVPVTNGAVGSYVYGDYTNDLGTDWVQVTHTFDIPTTGIYSIVIMNSKNPGANVLIDDFVLMKGDAKVISSRRRARK